MSTSSKTVRLSQTADLSIYYQAVIEALDRETQMKILRSLGGSVDANSSISVRARKIVSECRLASPEVLSRVFKIHGTEAQLQALHNMLEIRREEYNYEKGEQENIKVFLPPIY